MRPTALVRLALSGGRADLLRIVFTAIGTAVAALLLLAACNVLAIRSLGVPGPPPGTVAYAFDDGFQYIGPRAGLDDAIAENAVARDIAVEQVSVREWDPIQDRYWFNRYERYQSPLLDEPGLHVGVVITMLALLVPLTLFVGQCARIGAPNRDRRLAAFRMAGGTPRQVALVAMVESSVAALVGSAVGAVGFVGLRSLDPQTRDGAGLLRWPTDVSPPVWQYVAVVVVLPALVALGTRLALRQVSISPFGVLRHVPTVAPSALPAALFVVGLGVLAGIGVIMRIVGDLGEWVLVLLFAAFVMVVAGLSVGAAAIAQRLGRALARVTSSPAVLIAGRRADGAPFQSSRPAAAVLLVVLLSAAIAQTRVNFLASTDPGDELYRSTFDLLDIVLVLGVALSVAGLAVVVAESVVTRRRTLAALVASGTPLATIRRSIVVETLIAIVPLTPIAAASGTIAARTVFGGTVDRNGRDVAVAVPWQSLGVIVAGTLAAAIGVASIGLLLLPSSTAPSELRTAA